MTHTTDTPTTYYMHYVSGDVQTLDQWLDEDFAHEWVDEPTPTQAEIINHYIKTGVLIEVRKTTAAQNNRPELWIDFYPLHREQYNLTTYNNTKRREKRTMKKGFKDKLQENEQLEIEACKLVRELQNTNCGIGGSVKVYLACKTVLNDTTQKQLKEIMQEYCNNILEKIEKCKNGNSENYAYMIDNLKLALQEHMVTDKMGIIDFMFRNTLCQVFCLMFDIMYGNDIQYALGKTFKNQNIGLQISAAICEMEDVLKN